MRAADETGQTARADEAIEIEFRVRVSGRLDASSVPAFEKALRAALQGSPRSIVVDLSDVELIDHAGLTALLKTHLRGRQRGLPIELVPSDHEAVRQVAALTGADELAD
jgi:anti-sigma B factor antagonist